MIADPPGPTRHVSVMPDEVSRWLLEIAPTAIIDGTYGGGGHSRRLLRAMPAGDGRVLAIDRDPDVLKRHEQAPEDSRISLFVGSYERAGEAMRRLGWEAADALLLDLGLSSDQLDDAGRGFSYQADGPLDLRFDSETGIPAHEWLQRHGEREIADAIYEFGEERYSRRVAREIVRRSRERRPVREAGELRDICCRCVPRGKHHDIHPATRTFQALRIVVNDELGTLARTLAAAPEWIRPGGRIAVISFHSLEDRIVKQAFRGDPRWRCLTGKPLRPSAQEASDNPRSRSAKMRVAERTSDGV